MPLEKIDGQLFDNSEEIFQLFSRPFLLKSGNPRYQKSWPLHHMDVKAAYLHADLTPVYLGSGFSILS